MSVIQISIIIPVYNCEKYIGACLDSLLAQTLRPIEMVVVDDGSTDKTGVILDNYAGSHPEIIAVHKKNGGVSSARNLGLSVAKGKYIGFVDADDSVEPDMYQLLYDAARSGNSEIAMCNYDYIYENKTVCNADPIKAGEIHIRCRQDAEAFYLKYLAMHPVLWNKIYLRSFIEQCNIQFELDSGEDYLFNLRILPHLNRITLVSGCYYHYMQRKNSIMHSEICRYNQNTVALIDKYSPLVPPESLMREYVFANLITGFFFSDYCIACTKEFLKEQLDILYHSPYFIIFCSHMARGELSDLWKTGTMSRKYYNLLRLFAFACYKNRVCFAVACMWIITTYLTFRNRKTTRNCIEVN